NGSQVVPYLNRLADLLFVMARAADGGFRPVRGELGTAPCSLAPHARSGWRPCPLSVATHASRRQTPPRSRDHAANRRGVRRAHRRDEDRSLVPGEGGGVVDDPAAARRGVSAPVQWTCS